MFTDILDQNYCHDWRIISMNIQKTGTSYIEIQ